MKYLLLFFLVFSNCYLLIAQEQEAKKEPPPFKMVRAEESYAYLKNKDNNPYAKGFLDALKYIPLSQNTATYLTLGGEIRSRVESFTNRNWTEEESSFYSQRISFHANIHLGKHIRLFGELYHGYTSHEKEFLGYDKLDWHQGFLEIKLPLASSDFLSFRFGRQELGFGAARLVGLREGPNMRRSFDAGRVIYKHKRVTLQAFYGKEVRPLFNTFDNEFSLFDQDATNPKLWGLYTQIPIKGLMGNNEFYYLGFQSPQAAFSDVVGKETRHTIGLRRFGQLGRWKYNTEFIYQFGTLNEQNISAFNFETDWHFIFPNAKWQPNLGLKLDWSSGDKEIGDNKLNTFNPLFVNPAIYSLSTLITPANLLSIHPSISLRPNRKMMIYLDWGVFYRTSKNDALYLPPRFIRRPASGSSERSIGSQFGTKADYEFNRNLKLSLDFSYFIAGAFIEATGSAENTSHIAVSLSFRF